MHGYACRTCHWLRPNECQASGGASRGGLAARRLGQPTARLQLVPTHPSACLPAPSTLACAGVRQRPGDRHLPHLVRRHLLPRVRRRRLPARQLREPERLHALPRRLRPQGPQVVSERRPRPRAPARCCLPGGGLLRCGCAACEARAVTPALPAHAHPPLALPQRQVRRRLHRLQGQPPGRVHRVPGGLLQKGACLPARLHHYRCRLRLVHARPAHRVR